MNFFASLISLSQAQKDEQSKSLFFFALICIFQTSLQYICWTFQGARVYIEHQSISNVSLFFSVFTIASAISFTILTPTFLQLFGRKSHVFALALSLQVLSFWSILIPTHDLSFLVFAIVNGLGFGMFWCARHLFELMKTENDSGTRDKLNSTVAAIHQLMLILLPFFIAASAAITAHFLSFDPFLPVVGLVSVLLVPALILCFKIPDRFPKVFASKEQYKSIFTVIKQPEFYGSKLYLLAYGSHWSLRNFSIAIAGALIAKNIYTIGSSEAAGALLAWGCLILFHPFSRPALRHYLFYIGGIGLATSWIFFGFYPTVFALFALAFAKSVFQPLLEVGNHLYSQRIAENIAIKAQQFFFQENTSCPPESSKKIEFVAAALMVRELHISFWRLACLLAIPYLLSNHTPFEQLSSISILFAIACIALPMLAHAFLHQPSPNSPNKQHSAFDNEPLCTDDTFIHPSFFASNHTHTAIALRSPTTFTNANIPNLNTQSNELIAPLAFNPPVLPQPTMEQTMGHNNNKPPIVPLVGASSLKKNKNNKQCFLLNNASSLRKNNSMVEHLLLQPKKNKKNNQLPLLLKKTKNNSFTKPPKNASKP